VEIVKKSTGKIVGTSKTKKDAIGSMIHREGAEKRKKRKRK
jgi:hypothetical protein